MKARENPFATHRVEALLSFDPSWIDSTWEAILTDLKNLNYRAAIIGPHGSGKTTFIESLIPRLQSLGHVTRTYFFNEETHPGLKFSPDPDAITIIDGAEQLTFGEWRLVKKSAARLIVTQHRSGRFPALLRTKSTPAMLHAFAKKLAPGLAIDAPLLYRKHKGNLREALLECYDLC